ncbi:MAG: hypothetical protein ACI4XL_07170 [Bacillus sp. (in: firmicutes)]
MDEDALDMGRITLIQGAYPKNKNEVAIEAAYLKLIDDSWEIGEKKELRFGDKEKVVTLSGIIQDYSAKWTVPPNMEKGINDFPNIFTVKKNKELQEDDNYFLFYFDGSKETVEKAAHRLIEEYGIEQVLFND